jgi:transcription antitermination protein NusB
MLSRRHLRIKVLQALYALESAKDANMRLSEDFINESFKPNLDSMSPQEPLKLEGFAKIARLLLTENLKNDTVPDDVDTPTQAIVQARNALKSYQKRCEEDRLRIGRRLVPEVEGISDSYYFMLQLLVEITRLARNERERTYPDLDDPIALESGLDANQILAALAENQLLTNEISRRGKGWLDDAMFVRQVYQDVLRKDEKYREYCATKKHDLTEDQALCEYILREVLYKNEICTTFFEQNDLLWEENGVLIKKMVAKTLKSITETSEITFVPLTDVWEDDQYFMNELYKQTTENNNLYDSLIEEPLKNWDLERLALTDVLILKMGLAEMIHFSNIPVKVTINECIELAKEYSTPKSGKFVNGILDILSKKMIQNGTIKKSGRGLMDNK